MVNRRGFLKGLAGVLACAAAPQALLGQEFKWRAQRRASGLWVINPEWVTAPYEIGFLSEQGMTWPTNIVPVIYRRGDVPPALPGHTQLVEVFPVRLQTVGGEVVPLMKKIA